MSPGEYPPEYPQSFQEWDCDAKDFIAMVAYVPSWDNHNIAAGRVLAGVTCLIYPNMAHGLLQLSDGSGYTASQM